MSELELLRRLGDQIVPPPFDELRRTALRRTRRTATVVTVVVAAVATIVLGVVQQAVDDQHSAPPPIVQQPHQPHQRQLSQDPGRPVTYAVGTTVHVGDHSVSLPDRVVELDVTDDGVAVRTADDRIWFTDGSAVDEIGAVGESGWGDELWNHYVGRMVTGDSGSLVAWFEFTQPHRPEVVVYDASTGQVIQRAPVEMPSGTEGGLYSIDEEAAYGFTDLTFGEDLWPNWRIDLSTGTQTQQFLDEYQDILRSRGLARTLLISHHDGGQPGSFVPFDGLQQFAVKAGRVEAQGEQPLLVRDGLTEADFTFDAPAGYPDTSPVWLVQWVDDDTILLHAAQRDGVDLLQCQVSTGACTLAQQVPADAVVPELG